MSDAPNSSSPVLDVLAALKKLEHYCRASGVGAHMIDDEGTLLGAIDASGRRVASEGPMDCCCPLCGVTGEEDARSELRAQLYGAYQAERFGGKYIHLCPHSLLIWTAPIVIDGVLAAAFIGGPVMVLDSAEILADLVGSGKIPPEREAAAQAALETLPRVLPQRATSLAEILADVATLVGGAAPARLESVLQREEQQARISEYIHDLKGASEFAAAPAYPIEKEHELLNSISRGDKGESQRLLNEILGHIFFSSGQDPTIIRARVLELVVLLSRAALEGGADIERIFGLNYTYLNQIQKMRSVEDIAYWLSRIMVRFTDLVFNLKDVKHTDVIMKALRYINARYTEPITLDEVAGAVFLSPTYFSKIFNEEMKCRFTTYLNRLRIEKSKMLLKSGDTSLVDIAGLVGYEDQSYFTKVFKSIAGVSPGRYRESGGRLPRNEEIHDE